MSRFPTLAGLAALMAGTALQAGEVTLPGPQGPLSATAIAVPDARHAVVLISGSPFGVVDCTNSLEIMQLAGELPTLEFKDKKNKKGK